MQFKSILYCIFPVLLLAACTHSGGDGALPVPKGPTPPFIFYPNVLYGTDTVQQIMDVDLPVVRDTVNTPVIILVHGGAWVQGEKEDFTGTGLDTFFTANGCAVVNMNYRLDHSYAYPAPVDDIGLVMDYIKQKSADWKINPNRVCIMGKSSGSQLALLYAYSRNQDQRIKAVIDGFGPTNFTDTSVVDETLGVNVTVWLGPYPANAQLWREASPIFYMAGAVPTVIMQGSEDVEVLPIQSEMLEDSLMTRGTPFIYIPWVGDGHGWDQLKWNETKVSVMKWVKGYL